nr:MAG TPA: hypothetical protein [Caudoviricetes sp.]
MSTVYFRKLYFFFISEFSFKKPCFMGAME